jgi:hypothetical protein
MNGQNRPLLPCPFCGSPGEYVDGERTVGCSYSECDNYSVLPWDVWQRRAALTRGVIGGPCIAPPSPKVIAAMREVLRISDRKHVAWDCVREYFNEIDLSDAGKESDCPRRDDVADSAGSDNP